MRSVSQQFADALKQDRLSEARTLLQRHGPGDTRALLWLMMQGKATDDWLEQLLPWSNQITSELAEEALLLALAGPLPWEHGQQLRQWLLDKVGADWFERSFPLHHAAFHGRDDAFAPLAKTYERLKGAPMDWNALNEKGQPPLFVALVNTHLASVVTLLRSGASMHVQMKHPNGSIDHKVGVLEAALSQKGFMAATLKELWRAAGDHVALLKSLAPAMAEGGHDMLEADEADGVVVASRKKAKKKRM